MPTVVATIRCPCSQNRLPTIFGNTWPFESGQSGVASPASLLVTSAPAIIKKNVAQATKTAKRLRPRFMLLRLPIADCDWQSAIGNQKYLYRLLSIGNSIAGIICNDGVVDDVAALPNAKSALALPFADTVTCIVFSSPVAPPSLHATTV